jgi:outer membrane protein
MRRATILMTLLAALAFRAGAQEELTMEKAVATALEMNQSLRGAGHDLESTRWGTKNAYSRFLPKVTLDAGITRIDPETDRLANASLDFIRAAAGPLGIPQSMLADLRPFTYRDTYNTGVTVIQPLYNGGAEIAGVKAAGAMEDKSSFAYKDTEQDVIARTKIAYYQVLGAEELVSLASEGLERTKRYLEMTRRRESLGMRTRTDVDRWDVQRAADEASLIRAENLLAVRHLQLNEALGVDLSRAYRLAKPAPVDTLPPNTTIALGDLEAHPAWQMMEANLRLADAGVSMSWTAFKPRINAAFQYGWEKNNTIALDGYRPWALGLSISWPIFNGFGDYANLQKASEEYDRTQSQVELFRRGLLMQATSAQLNVRAALQLMDVAEKSRHQAREVLDSVTRRYETGGASNVDLIDVETAYTSANVNYINAVYDYSIARVQLARATGTVVP